MKNLSIWAWMPEDYNPQGKQLSFMQIRQQVQLFNLPPKSLGMTSPLGWLALTISDWAREEQRDGNTDEALESYEDFLSETAERGCFYIEYLPDDNFHEFHAMLIETATQKGLIVLSDFSEAVFYPDGTSEPAMAFQAIQESRDEEMLAQSNTMNSSLAELLSGAKEVRTKDSATTLAYIILKNYLGKKGVKYDFDKNQATIFCEDYKVILAISTDFFSQSNRTTAFFVPNDDYPNKSLLHDYMTDIVVYDFINKNDFLKFEWNWIDNLVAEPRFIKDTFIGSKSYKNLKLDNNKAIYDYINYHLDILFELLDKAQNFNDLVNIIYEDENTPIHQVLFEISLVDLQNSKQPYYFLTNLVKRKIIPLFLVNQPKAIEYFNKLQLDCKDYISKTTPEEKEHWAEFIKNYNNLLNHGLNQHPNNPT